MVDEREKPLYVPGLPRKLMEDVYEVVGFVLSQVES
jgi:hypothetical protein